MSDAALAARLEALERQNTRLRRAFVAFALLAGALVWMGQMPILPNEVRASRLMLIDESGATRLDLRIDDGRPLVALLDDDGQLVRLTGGGGRGVIEYRDDRGAIRDLAAPAHVRPLTSQPR